MAKIDCIKLSKKREDGKAEVLVRLYVTKTFRPQFHSGLFLEPERFISLDETKRCRNYKIDIPRKRKLNVVEVAELNDVSSKLGIFLRRLQTICDKAELKHKDELTKDWIEAAVSIVNKNSIPDDEISFEVIQQKMKEEQEQVKEEERKANEVPLFDRFEECITKGKDKHGRIRSKITQKNWRVLERAMKRYELFLRMTDKKQKSFRWDFDTINKDTIDDFESFLRNEHTLLEEYPKIFEKIPYTTDTKRRSPKPVPRGNNTICALFNKLKAFFNWCIEQGYTNNQPFRGYDGIKTESYGTPFYISIEERNLIADFDLSEYPALSVQRDIFIFQCCVGCRVSDLIRFTPKSITNGKLEYFPRKTKKNNPVLVSVPLNARARNLLAKYKGADNQGRLFPFISSQRYNEDIKKIFKLCGVTRMVTVLNSVTGEDEQKSIADVASSHMARRCFVGGLYEKVQDPNLICPLSGHSYGSKAFERYRTVSEEMKKKLTDLIN